MPNAKVLENKQEIVRTLVEKLKNSAAGVLVDYKGIDVADDTKLRADMRKAGVEYIVVKNTLLRFAANEIGFTEWDGLLHGTTALATSADDAVAPAKIIMGYSKKLGEVFNIKGGFVDGKIASPDEIKALAELPSKEQLQAQVASVIAAPLYGFVNVMNAHLTGLLYAMGAHIEKLEKESA